MGNWRPKCLSRWTVRPERRFALGGRKGSVTSPQPAFVLFQHHGCGFPNLLSCKHKQAGSHKLGRCKELWLMNPDIATGFFNSLCIQLCKVNFPETNGWHRKKFRDNTCEAYVGRIWWGGEGRRFYFSNLGPCQVLLALINLVFAAPGLSWSNPTDSLELFAGECAITRGEHRDRVCKTLMFSSCKCPSICQCEALKLYLCFLMAVQHSPTTKLTLKSFHHPGSFWCWNPI